MTIITIVDVRRMRISARTVINATFQTSLEFISPLAIRYLLL